MLRAYINSIKPSIVAYTAQPAQNHVFFLKTLTTLALSAALLGIGLLIVCSSLPTSLGTVVMLSGTVLGVFAYKARNEPEITTDQSSLNQFPR